VAALSETGEQQLAVMGQAGRDYYTKNFHPDTLAQALRNRFGKLVAGAG